MKIPKHQFSSKERGFTMVETLMAITLLILAVTGAYAAAQNGISSAIFSKDQIIAFYLAQEGVEVVRNRRDQNSLSGASWLSGITDANLCGNGKNCKVDALDQNNPIQSCPQGVNGCPYLKLNDNGFYSYDSGNDSIFRRVVSVNSINANEVAVTVTVTWSKGLLNLSFKATENLYNWQ